tara:strand:- start:46 stop:984 length:939 start_codon:yes stop_codon:yes gene_type:complete
MSNFAITFPGQGSQSLGMLSELAKQSNLVKETFDEASEVVKLDLWGICQSGSKESLNDTLNTQPIMLTAGVTIWRLWVQSGGASPDLMAGHSLGEYSALVASGAIKFEDALQLVLFRGKFMQKAVLPGEGAMAAILGLDDQKVEEICGKASEGQVVESVNYNSPGQIVIAGNVDAINRAVDLAKEAGARKSIFLDVSVPSHCSLMVEASDNLYKKLQEFTFFKPKINVLHNVNSESTEDQEQIKILLKNQLCSPVRWSDTIKKMSARGITIVLEFGPGKVLSGLCKRIDKSLLAISVNDDESLSKALESTNV